MKLLCCTLSHAWRAGRKTVAAHAPRLPPLVCPSVHTLDNLFMSGPLFCLVVRIASIELGLELTPMSRVFCPNSIQPSCGSDPMTPTPRCSYVAAAQERRMEISLPFSFPLVGLADFSSLSLSLSLSFRVVTAEGIRSILSRN